MAVAIAILAVLYLLVVLHFRAKDNESATIRVEVVDRDDDYIPPSIAFIDLETTGLSPGEGERVVEIAVIRNEYFEDKLQCFHALINPEGKKVSKKAIEIHGYTNDMLADKCTFAEVAEELTDLLQDCELVAHNAPFDVGFLDAEFSRVGMPPVSEICWSVTDTLRMARKMYPRQRNTLDAVATRAGIDVKKVRPSHNAKTDVKILYEVYLFLLGQQHGMDYKKEGMLREVSKW